MEKLDTYGNLKQLFQRFERAAVKEHEESIWIVSVVKGAEKDRSALKEAFAQTETPLGWYLAGYLAEEDSREQFDFHKKSAEGGCSWGQVRYGDYFRYGDFVEKDKKVYLEWLEKAANQNNPWAIDKLGEWFRDETGDQEKAVSYYRAGAELGWKNSMEWLSVMLRKGEGCEKDLRQAAIWGAKESDSIVFWDLLADAKGALESRATENLDYNFDQLCYSLGYGLYWYQYESGKWDQRSDKIKIKVFVISCMDYYCSCVELQQKSIFTLLLCWNRTTGVKGPGQMIARRVWEGREDNLLKRFEVRSE
jgi:hypothetical protein